MISVLLEKDMLKTGKREWNYLFWWFNVQITITESKQEKYGNVFEGSKVQT